MFVKMLVVKILYFFKGNFNVNIKYIEDCKHFTNNIEFFYTVNLDVSNFSDKYGALNFLIKDE